MDSDNAISDVLPPQKFRHETPKPTVTSPSTTSSTQGGSISEKQDLAVDRTSLTLGLDQLNIHEPRPMAERMFLSLGVIFQEAAEKLDLDIDAQGLQITFNRADQNSRNGTRDLEVLATVQTVLELLTPDSNYFVEAATILANASRDETWRLPFGQSGLLALFLRIQAIIGVEERALIPLLKFIGNTCADIDDLDMCPDVSVQIVVELLQADDLDADDMLPIVHTINAFLKHGRFQQHFIEYDLVYTLMEIISKSSLAYDTSLRPVDPDEISWSSLQKSVTEILSDISATGAFVRKYTIDSALADGLIQWLQTQQQPKQICSCLILGNLAQSDLVCREMVSRLRLHDRLLAILEDPRHPQVSHAVLGFLRNLSLPAENKAIVGSQHAVEIIARFWSVEVNSQIQHASVALVRQLLNSCIANVKWLLESLSPDPDSPAYEKTYLSLLLLLFGRTDDAATRFETGRTVATICRCISTSSQGLPPQSTNAVTHRLYGLHPNIATPLAMMISQSRFPVLRSEGWFALALMARSGEGSAAVSEVFQQLETFGVLVSTITGQSPTSERPATGNTTTSSDSTSSDKSPGQVQNMKDKDRENALVLVNELLRHNGDNLSDIRRSVLQDLMRGPQSPERAEELMTRAKSEERQ
ncbi:MAG: hypothetical protein Q9169_007779, partial [Polycauliona sp. 2 TL-2023]